MANIRTRKGSKFLLVDFMYMGQRCRETTNLEDNPANRKRLEKVVQKMQAEITLGIFDYKSYFPKSNRAELMQSLKERADTLVSDTPLFGEFAELWFEEKKLEWRKGYQYKIRVILDKYLIKYFGQRAISGIQRADALAFRTSLAKVIFGKANNTLSAARINSIMMTLNMILDEAAKRYKFENTIGDIKKLRTCSQSFQQ